MYAVNKLFLFLALQKIITFKLVYEVCIIVKVKQTKINLQKYFHPSSLNQLIYAIVHCREKGSNFKEDDDRALPL